MKQPRLFPYTADACFLVDIHLKYVSLAVTRVQKQGLSSCIYHVRHLVLLKNNYLILQKPLSLRWHLELKKNLTSKQNKTLTKTKPNQFQYQKSEMSNPLSNAQESKTAPRCVSSFSCRVLVQMPIFLQRRQVPHCCQVLGRRKNPPCWDTGFKAPSAAVSHQAQTTSHLLQKPPPGSLPSREASPAPTQGTDRGNSSLNLSSYC